MKTVFCQFLFLVLLSNFCLAQIQSGKVTYKVKNNQAFMEKTLSDGTFSSDTKGFAKMQFDKIEQIIPYLTFHLSFNQNESHFSTLKQMQKDNGPDTKLTFALLGVRGDYYANLKEDKTLQQFQYLN